MLDSIQLLLAFGDNGTNAQDLELVSRAAVSEIGPGERSFKVWCLVVINEQYPPSIMQN